MFLPQTLHFLLSRLRIFRLAIKGLYCNGMRKRTKLKKRSCTLCKPHKMCGACRWTNRDLSRLKEFERERKQLIEQ